MNRNRRRIAAIKKRIRRGQAKPGDLAVLAQLEGDITRAAIDPPVVSTGAAERTGWAFGKYRGKANEED